MDFDGKIILVTGAAGFIGSNIVSNLLSYGSQVWGIDNFSTGRAENMKNFIKDPSFKLIRGDIRNFDDLNKIPKDIDIIFHEAAFTSVPRSVEKPLIANDVNVNGTLNVLTIARELDVQRIVFASSSSVYGEKEILPKQEDMLPEPISPYGVSKLAVEKYLYSYHKVYGLKTTSLRYFNVYGPNQIDSPYSGVISKFIAWALTDQPLIVFGDGTQSRDFTYVQDVVQANFLAATKNDAIGQVFNVGSNSQVTILELAKKVLELCNKSHLEIQFKPSRPGDVMHSKADINHAKDLLDFNPQFNLDKGIKETIKWFQQELENTR